jgi:hypothetical protein
MSIDTLGHRAAEDLRSAVADLDVERSLTQALAPRESARRWATALVVATVVMVLVLGWVGSGLFTDEQSAPPLDSAPRDVVGGRLSVPVELTVPEGWGVTRDAQAVVLHPLDGSNSSMTLIGQPVMVYQPPDYRLRPLGEDIVVWTTTHPDLKVSDRFGLDGPGFAWTGTEMELALSAGASDVPLVPVPGRPYPLTPLEITTADRTFLWDVVYLADSPPLVVASQSPIPDDAALKAARSELLQSLQVNPPPN